MAEYIDREAAANIFSRARSAMRPEDYRTFDEMNTRDLMLLNAEQAIRLLPAADVVEVVRGKWEDVHIDRPEIADIEVASMFCPKCNRWHNEVYHYGNPIEFVNFCSFCGADMRRTENEIYAEAQRR